MESNTEEPKAAPTSGLTQNFLYYAIRWLALGGIGGLFTPVVSLESATNHFWIVKMEQVFWGLVFGALCAVVFTVCQNALNVARKRPATWAIAVGVWLGVKFAWVGFLGPFKERTMRRGSGTAAMLRFSALIIILLCTLPSWAVEKQGSVIRSFAGKEVRLVIPAAYCLMDKESPQGKLFYQLQEQGNKGINVVAAIFADCKEWAIRRENPAHRIRRYGSYLFTLSDGKEVLAPEGYSRDKFLQQLAVQESTEHGLGSNASREDLIRHLNQKLKVVDVPTASSMTQLNLGLIAVSEYGAFYGLGVTVNYPKESPRVTSVIAMTLVNDVFVSINLYDDFSEREVFGRLLNEQRRNAEDFVKANTPH